MQSNKTRKNASQGVTYLSILNAKLRWRLNLIRKFISFAWKHKGWLIIFATFLIGLVLYIFGIYLSTNASTENGLQLAAESLKGIGSLLAISGVTGTITKIIALEGYFLSAVSEAAFSKIGLTKLNSRALHDVWVDTTRFLYFPHISGGQDNKQNSDKINSMQIGLEEALRKGFPLSAKHFVDRHDRTLTVTWKDKENSIITIKDDIQSELIPFDSTKALTWESDVKTDIREGFGAPENSPVEDILLKRTDVKEEIAKKSIQVTEKISPDGTIKKRIYSSDASAMHGIYRKRIWTLKITNDPNIYNINQQIMRHCRVVVHNEADDLIVLVSFIGRREEPKFIDGEKLIEANRKAIFEYEGLLLPDQGYAFTFIKKTQ